MSKVIPNLQLFLILCLICLLIFGLDSIHWLIFPKTALSYLANPISYGLYKTKQQAGNQLFFIVASRTAAKENKALQEQLGVLLFENATLRTKLAEVEARLEQRAAINPATYNLIPVRPVGLDRFLFIDKGSIDGIKNGQAVIFKDSYIGQIVKVSERGAAIRLSTDPDSKLSAFAIGTNGKAKGILSGEFGSEMLLDKILHQESIEIGNLIYSEGLEITLPRGLVLGKVTEVLEKKDQVFKAAKVTPMFDIGDLDLVFVIGE